MAVLDSERGSVVIRIVYDGPPMAGKTTSVRALANGLGGEVVVPEEIDGRTVYFDWLDYTGGLFEGHRIRCQIVTVPGQAILASRRRRLLESADVVVFVGDSSPQAQSSSRRYLEGLRAVLDTIEGPPVGIVMQANKRDLPDATPLDRLKEALDSVGLQVAVMESSAIQGQGVRETFVFAVRLALDRIRELMRLGLLRRDAPEIDTAQALLDELRATEGDALKLATDSGRLTHIRLSDLQEPALAAVALAEAIHGDRSGEEAPAPGRPAPEPTPDEPTPDQSIPDQSIPDQSIPDQSIPDQPLPDQSAPDEPTPERTPSSVPLRIPLESTPKPPDDDLPSGMIWPPVNGRLILHETTTTPPRLWRESNGSWIGSSGGQWRLYSHVDAVYANLELGRGELLDWARLHSGSAHLLSPQRCIALADDGHGRYRLWQVIRVQSSLRDALQTALAQDAETIVRTIFFLAQTMFRAAELWGGAACRLPLRLSQVGINDSGVVYLGKMPLPGDMEAPEPRGHRRLTRLLDLELIPALQALGNRREDAIRVLDRMRAPSSADHDDAYAYTRRLLTGARASSSDPHTRMTPSTRSPD